VENVGRTIISQYANSPTLTALIDSLNSALDTRPLFQQFFDDVFNVDTAVGFGLDYWGRIVGIPNGRLLQLGVNNQILGYLNDDIPPDWAPFNQGTFFTGADSSTTFVLADDAFRILILAKALANITATNSKDLNRLLRNLFPGRGRAYVIDRGKSNTATGGMVMSFVFEFALTAVEYAILTQSGVLPHPAGVGFNVIVIPAGQFNFREEGQQATPFGSGTFYLPPH
jgi:hypothetical protein